MSDTPKQKVILVHGTFASSGQDEGHSWWQRGSYFWNELEKRLPDNVEMVNDRKLFRWSGENLESERSNAAAALCFYIEDLERKKIPYHIIAHSHGGNVVWKFFSLSFLLPRNNREFTLASWTSIGTPFFIFDRKNHPNHYFSIRKASWERKLLALSSLFLGVLILEVPSLFLLIWVFVTFIVFFLSTCLKRNSLGTFLAFKTSATRRILIKAYPKLGWD